MLIQTHRELSRQRMRSVTVILIITRVGYSGQNMGNYMFHCHSGPQAPSSVWLLWVFPTQQCRRKENGEQVTSLYLPDLKVVAFVLTCQSSGRLVGTEGKVCRLVGAEGWVCRFVGAEGWVCRLVGVKGWA